MKNKLIKYYHCEPQVSLSNIGYVGETKTSIELLKMVFSSVGAYPFKYSNEDYSIDILEIGEQYIFGTCAKKNDISFDKFYQTRFKHDATTAPYSSESEDKQLEVYTYFYIDCTKNKMVAIMQKNIPNVNFILTQYIIEKSGNTLNFFIGPIMIKDKARAAKMLSKSKTIEIAFAPNFSITNIPKLGDFNVQSEKFSCKIKLSEKDADIVIDKLYESFNQSQEDFRTLKIIGKNEYGLDETINFIESYFTQKTPFNLSNDYATNTQYIKEQLVIAIEKDGI